jgi:Cof subfamily protein (haloacid dehalogenase superfamily)
MDKKIIFIDIDGTLVGNNGKVPVSARKACLKAKENGHLLCIATGRQYNVIGNDILSINFDGIISAGGGRIDAGSELIANTSFDRQILSHILEYFEKYKIGLTFERTDCLLASKYVFDYFNSVSGIFSEIINFYIKCENVVMGELSASYTDVAKVIFCDNGSLTIDDVRREFDGECEVFRGSMPFYGKNSGEINPMGINKGVAVDKILQYYGITKENSFAIGDGDNDISMLDKCGHGIAMGNGDEVLKRAAEYVTDSIENDGIMKAFKHYNLI